MSAYFYKLDLKVSQCLNKKYETEVLFYKSVVKKAGLMVDVVQYAGLGARVKAVVVVDARVRQIAYRRPGPPAGQLIQGRLIAGHRRPTKQARNQYTVRRPLYAPSTYRARLVSSLLLALWIRPYDSLVMREALFHTICMKSKIIGSRSRKVQVYKVYMHHNHTEHFQMATIVH